VGLLQAVTCFSDISHHLCLCLSPLILLPSGGIVIGRVCLSAGWFPMVRWFVVISRKLKDRNFPGNLTQMIVKHF